VRRKVRANDILQQDLYERSDSRTSNNSDHPRHLKSEDTTDRSRCFLGRHCPSFFIKEGSLWCRPRAWVVVWCGTFREGMKYEVGNDQNDDKLRWFWDIIGPRWVGLFFYGSINVKGTPPRCHCVLSPWFFYPTCVPQLTDSASFSDGIIF
jgi:hypothetical protein